MCGIQGFWGEGTPGDIERMAAATTHRGPNGTSTEYRDGVAFGHNRLAVIDVSTAGTQPMHSSDGRYSIVYNGEIYNYKVLRKELQELGFSFTSASDTEVLLAGYQAWGSAVTKKLKGMWAFAIHDMKEKKIFLARDPWGIKPLYFYSDGNLYAFASEIRGLLAHTKVKRDLNRSAMQDLLYLGYIPAPRTILTYASSLIPGEQLHIDLETNVITREVLRLEAEIAEAPSDRRLWEALHDSVERHLISDVPVGLFFSGGTDSTLIALLLKELGIPLTAYHLALEGRDDTPYAARIAEQAGLAFVPVPYALKERSLLRFAAEHMDSPTADTSFIPNLVLSEQAKHDVRVVLSGAGGDELFAGYKHHARLLRTKNVNLAEAPLYERAVSWCMARFPNLPIQTVRSIARRIETLTGNSYGVYTAEKSMGWSLINDTSLQDLIHTRLSEREVPDSMLALDRLLFLPDDILMTFDVATMAHGIEGRVPFLDTDVFALVGGVPNSWKEAKEPLKRLVASKLPAELAYRPKTGFSLPLSYYIFSSSEDKDVARDALMWYQKNLTGISHAFDTAVKRSVESGDLTPLITNFPHVLYALSLLYLFCERHSLTL